MAVAIAGLIGVLVGALLVTIIFNLRIRYEEQKENNAVCWSIKSKKSKRWFY